jgi:lipopolysaccharide assembly outer membrane protein LptD (OstA)
MMKRALLLTLVLGSNTLLDAQAPEKMLAQQMEQRSNFDITRMTGGVTLHTGDNVIIRTETAEFDRSTGQMLLSDPVVLRQDLRPASQTIAAVNAAGASFPEAKPVTVRTRGDIQISAGELILRADEADVNGLTGEMVLRGNVKVSRPNWKTLPVQSPVQP